MAVVTGNDYDHIDIQNGSNTTRHMLKDSTARTKIDNLVEVSSTQPASADNEIWVSPSSTEYQVPTYDEFSNLKSAINYNTDFLNITSADITQGVYETPTITVWNKRICINRLIPIRSGAKFVYQTNDLQIFFGLWAYDSSSQIMKVDWHTVSTQTEYQFQQDGLFFVQFKRADGDVVAPSDYDATCKLYYGSEQYLRTSIKKTIDDSVYVNNTIYGNALGVYYQTQEVYTTGSSWSVRNIISSIDLKAGYTYSVKLKMDRAFNVSSYARIYDSNNNELSVSPAINGKSEIEWAYTPSQNYSGAKIGIAYGSADSYLIYCIVSYWQYDAVDNIQKQLSMASVPSFMLRQGSLFNKNNTNNVSIPVIKTLAKHIEVCVLRPNSENCKYQYNIATITAPIDDILDSPSAYDGYTEIVHPYYTSTDCTKYGIQISICEYNTSTNGYTTLSPSDFEGYPILIYMYDGIPMMYQSYITSRLDTIKNLDASIGNSGDSFIFITDQHQRGNDYISPYLAKHIIRNSSVKRLIYGGDYINTPDSKALAIQQINNAVDSDDVIDSAIFMQGNHETNPYGTGAISESELYGILNRRIERFVDTNRENYYAFDNIAQKIRYIVLNTGEDGVIDSTQAAWVKTVADELSAEWNIIILSHMALHIEQETGRDAISLYGVVASVVNALADTQATICCWICGHTHVDASDTTSYDFPIICVTCDSDSQGTWYSDNRDAQTINRGAFDVFHVDTANHKIYATRIGGGQTNVLSTGDLTDNDREWTYTV